MCMNNLPRVDTGVGCSFAAAILREGFPAEQFAFHPCGAMFYFCARDAMWPGGELVSAVMDLRFEGRERV